MRHRVFRRDVNDNDEQDLHLGREEERSAYTIKSNLIKNSPVINLIS